MYHKDVIIVVNRHDDYGVPPGVPRTCVGMKFHPVPRAHEQARRVRSMELEIRLASAQGWSILRTPPETLKGPNMARGGVNSLFKNLQIN